jgi:hypothetical protein
MDFVNVANVAVGSAVLVAMHVVIIVFLFVAKIKRVAL